MIIRRVILDPVTQRFSRNKSTLSTESNISDNSLHLQFPEDTLQFTAPLYCVFDKLPPLSRQIFSHHCSFNLCVPLKQKIKPLSGSVSMVLWWMFSQVSSLLA